jgi:hypothetical protein
MSYAISGLGTGNLSPEAMQYFLQAYNTNPSFYGAPSSTTSQAVTNAQTSTDTQAATKATQYPGLVATKPEEESSNTGLILSGIATVGALAMCVAAHGKGSGKTAGAKIMDGFSKMFKGGKEKLTSLAKAKSEFTMRTTSDGKRVFTLPDKKGQTIKGTSAEISEQLKKLGIETPEASKVLADTNSKITDFEMIVNHGGINNKVVVRKGKLVKLTNEANESVMGSYTGNSEFQSAIDKAIEKVISKDSSALADTSLTNIGLTQKTDNAIYRYVLNNGTTEPKLRYALTNRFGYDSTAVKAYLDKNPSMNSAVETYMKKGTTEGLKLKTADYTTPIGTVKIEGDKIKGIVVDGKFLDVESDAYHALHKDNAKILDNVFDNTKKFTNTVWNV